ncbi:hypothetical protein J6590_008114 [Homalodisca vitripennis]|nr:hypothetical protein J6590_008114 [Homalodisca vitripennis]
MIQNATPLAALASPEDRVPVLLREWLDAATSGGLWRRRSGAMVARCAIMRHHLHSLTPNTELADVGICYSDGLLYRAIGGQILRLAVAYSAHYDVVVTRAVNRTLTALSADLTAAGFSLTPIYSPLPTTFSAPYLADLSAAWTNRSVVAVLVFATDGPGLTPALAAAASDLPVLWATGEVGDGYLSRVSEIFTFACFKT